MRRGELYLVDHPVEHDPRKRRAFVVISRQALIDTRHSTVICAPVYTRYHGLSTQVPVGVEEGLKHDSSIHCDELISMPRQRLTNRIGTLSPAKLIALNQALAIALDLPPSELMGYPF